MRTDSVFISKRPDNWDLMSTYRRWRYLALDGAINRRTVRVVK